MFERLKIHIKKVVSTIRENHFFPLKKSNIRRSHITIILVLAFITLLKIMFYPVETSREDLIITMNKRFCNAIEMTNEISLKEFSLRELSIYENLRYYLQIETALRKYSKNKDVFSIPKPKYPLISNILKPFYDEQLLPPTILLNCKAKKTLGSGITISSKD